MPFVGTAASAEVQQLRQEIERLKAQAALAAGLEAPRCHRINPTAATMRMLAGKVIASGNLVANFVVFAKVAAFDGVAEAVTCGVGDKG